MNFSFAGCGFLGIYHVGVAACLKKYAPNLLVNKISGASAGALAAVCLLCDAPLGVITSSVLKTATEARKHFMGPFSPGFNVEKLLREGLLSVLPPDAHIRVSGRLFISVTRISDGKNILLSNFETKEELIKCLLATSFIPGFSGWAPISVRGVRYIDGGFTDNLPQLDHQTVIVSPFCGEADICPKDNNAGLLTVSLANTSIELSKENLYRFARILFPPAPEILSKMCQQGFNDALDFLQRNCLINCTRCLAVQSTFNIPDEDEVEEEVPVFEDHLNSNVIDSCCKDCNLQRQEAILDQLPETVGSILQEAIEAKGGSSISYLFSYKPLNFLSVLSLPYVIPAKVFYTACSKLLNSAPTSISDVKALGNEIALVVSTVVKAWLRRAPPVNIPHEHHHHQQQSKAFSCQLAITEFTGENDVRHNFEFAIDLDDAPDMQRPDISPIESESLNHLAIRCAERTLDSRTASRVVSRVTSRVPSRCVSRTTSRPASRAPSHPASRVVSRAVSRVPSMENLNNLSDYPHLINPSSSTPGINDDTFEQILNVTNNQEALMAYYYLDDNNEVRVTEIFDMSNEEPKKDTLSPYDNIHHDRQLSPWNLDSHLEKIENRANRCPIITFNDSYDSEAESVGSMSDPEVDQQIHGVV